MKAYKGFSKDEAGIHCRGFRFAEGETYTHQGDPKMCVSGFHACLKPLDVFSYYAYGFGHEFREVDIDGGFIQAGGDSKVCAETIKIGAQLTLDELVELHVAAVIAEGKESASSGNFSTAASSGNSSAAASSGSYSTAVSSGDFSKAASSGDSSKAASSGNFSTAASSGNSSKAECETNGFACVAGELGLVRGNLGSALSLGWVDAEGKNRIAVAYVGEDGILPGVWYRVGGDGKFQPA